MTIRWLIDADRQDLRDAAEERRVLDELIRKYRLRQMTAEERDKAVAYYRDHGESISGLPIDRYRRS